MNHNELLHQIRGKQFSRSYFFCGAEDYLIDVALSKLIEAKVDPASKEFNLDIFYAKEVEGNKIVDTANAYPMMADTRLVIVKNAMELPLTILERIAKYLEKPSPTAILVLISEKADLRKKIVSRIKSNSCFVEFKPLYDRQIPPWIRDYLHEKGYEISQEAVLLLQARIGNHLRNLVNELEKIMVNLDGKKKIGAEDVENIAGYSRNFSVFELNDAIGYKDLKKSLAILTRMLESGEAPTGVLAMISRHFMNLAKLKGAVQQNKSQKEIAAITGIPSFFVEKSKRMAENFSLTQLEVIFEALLHTDEILKTSRQPPQLALQSLLVRIAEKN